MFTGIIRIFGVVAAVECGDVQTYAIDFPHDGLEIGASVSVDGTCQTAIAVDDHVWFQAVGETLKRTTLGNLKVGQQVHIERSARIGDEIGGHMLSGHIYCTSMIQKIEENIYTFSVPNTTYLFEKGYVAVDGMSLTVVDVFEDAFTVHLIPETLKVFHKKVGDFVNIEFDSLTMATVKTVERILKSRDKPI
ncbi:MAG: riboflavin synthase subunit alpha [Chlamydiales bacterium]|nr:riboflavin synthase subunit alpha [Chlamydiales bacterium]